MLKARNKKVSLLLVLAMLMTLFVGIGSASAATTYSAVTVPTFDTVSTTADLGIIEVNLSTAIGVKAGDILTVSLPSTVTTTKSLASTTAVTAATGAPGPQVVVPATLPGTTIANGILAADVTYATGSTGKSIDISFNAAGAAQEAVLYVYINQATIEADADIVATMLGSNNAVFPVGQVTVGKVVTGKGTNATIKSVKTIGTDGGAIDTITLLETKTNTIQSGDTIKFKLPNGFGWTALGASTNWAFAGYILGYAGISSDNRTATFTITNTALNPFTPSDSASGLGRIDFGGAIYITDDSLAKMGDVNCTISGTNVSTQTITVATLGDYGTTVEAGDVDSAIAGWDADLADASFKIKETLAGSLLNGRNITLTLPAGCKWITSEGTEWPENGSDTPLAYDVEKGSATITTDLAAITSTNNGRTLKLTVNNPGTAKSVIEFSDFQVAIKADFSGDLNVEVAGTAGAKGTIKIADVSPALAIAAASKKDIVIGSQNQVIGDVTLKESTDEAIDPTNGAYAYLRLPAGATWSADPTVSVTDGDVTIDSINTDGRYLIIEFKSSSSKASTITISDIKVTLDRTVPEGDFKLSIVGCSDGYYSGALTDNSWEDMFNVATIGSAVVANCVTPAGSSSSGTFKINSNIYTVNGVTKVMDAAPYIKNGRTYVPMRYAAEIVGAEVVWNETAKTVTLTKGSTTVVFTIGSTNYTVNGEAKTCDVAPEISNSRTMLPARYVAEAFGATVGWDAASQTVVIQ